MGKDSGGGSNDYKEIRIARSQARKSEEELERWKEHANMLALTLEYYKKNYSFCGPKPAKLV